MRNSAADLIKEPLLVILFCLIAISLFFYPAVFNGQIIYRYHDAGSDALDLNVPRRYLAVQSLRNYGEIPLWEPKIGCGTPMFAESEIGFFHPALLFYFCDDLTFAANLTILSAVFIAMLGAYAWGRSIGLEPLAAGIAAAAFGLGKNLLLRTAGLNIMHVIAWLPGSLALIHWLAVTAKKRYWFGLVLVWVCQILAGHMQMFVICNKFYYCWWYMCNSVTSNV